jgi:hypothetical protein
MNEHEQGGDAPFTHVLRRFDARTRAALKASLQGGAEFLMGSYVFPDPLSGL